MKPNGIILVINIIKICIIRQKRRNLCKNQTLIRNIMMIKLLSSNNNRLSTHYSNNRAKKIKDYLLFCLKMTYFRKKMTR
jgi:hypothetical protein